MKQKRKLIVGECEVSANAQKVFDKKLSGEDIISVIRESVIVNIDDEYGDSEYSPAFFNEDKHVIMPLRNREGENGWGIPTVIDERKVDIVGRLFKCFECDSRCHINRDECYKCGEEIIELSPFFWRGIEITVHCQTRAVERLNIPPSEVKNRLVEILDDGVFVPFSDNHEGETVCILNESERTVFPLRNREEEEGVGVTTVINSGYEGNLSNEDFRECSSCDKIYHNSREKCPNCSN